MRRFSLFILGISFVFLLASCSASKLRFSLNENPTTGYQWQWEQDGIGRIRLLEDEYLQQKQGAESVGAAGVRTFVFTGEKAGDVTLILSYRRSWETTDFDVNLMYHLNVSDKMEVSISPPIR